MTTRALRKLGRATLGDEQTLDNIHDLYLTTPLDSRVYCALLAECKLGREYFTPLTAVVSSKETLSAIRDYVIGFGSALNPLPPQSTSDFIFNDTLALSSDWMIAASDFNDIVRTFEVARTLTATGASDANGFEHGQSGTVSSEPVRAATHVSSRR